MHTFPADHQAFGACRPDQMHGQRQALPHKIHTQIDFRILDKTVRCPDAEICGGCETGATTDSATVPGCDGDLIDAKHGVQSALANAKAPAPHHQRVGEFGGEID